MIWAGSPFAHLIEFGTGLPTGAVTYSLVGNDGSLLIDAATVTPDAGALSYLLVIDGSNNGCAQPLFENRTLIYTYTTATGIISDRIVYRVAKPIPFAASTDGVRNKLGVEPHELADEEIDIVSAYSELLTFGDPTNYETSGDRNTLLMIHAIEAIAALLVADTLQIKLAVKESNGTGLFQRFTGPDWQAIEDNLQMHIARARQLLDSEYDATGATYQAFGKIIPTPDVITQA